MSNSPIGVFDSGIGGLTVLRALRQELPQENFIYFADTAHVPYGNKRPYEIEARNRYVLSWMKAQQVKMLVIACHTSSAFYPSDTSLPIITMLHPTLDAIMGRSFSKGLGILATPLSVTQGTLTSKLKERGFSAPIYPLSCPTFVPLIEQNKWVELTESLPNILSFFCRQPVDYILHGCTHYPMLEPYLPKDINIPFIDPSPHVAHHVKTYLKMQNLLCLQGHGSLFVHCTGSDNLLRLHLKDSLAHFIS